MGNVKSKVSKRSGKNGGKKVPEKLNIEAIPDEQELRKSSLLALSRNLSQLNADGRKNPPSLSDISVVKELGKGSFGKVEHVILDGLSYALKTMSKKRFFRSCDHSGLAWNERNCMLACNSPFILPLEAAFQSEHELFMLTPLYAGGDLLGRLRAMETRPSSDAMTFYLAEMVLALEHLVEHNICHRDIKPDNIFINYNGHLVLGDMGLAIEVDGSETSRKWGRCGSYGYRAPEVVQDLVCSYASDVYSLGITMYFFAFGGVPWSETAKRLEREKKSGKNTLFFPEGSQISCEIKDLLAQMLEVDPSKRITVAEMKIHPAFASVEWDALVAQTQAAPWQPVAPNKASILMKAVPYKKLAPPSDPLPQRRNKKFAGFEFFPEDEHNNVRPESITKTSTSSSSGGYLTTSASASPADTPITSPYTSPANSPPSSFRTLGVARSPQLQRRSILTQDSTTSALHALATKQLPFD
jgi:serine/threonine protein kinase